MFVDDHRGKEAWATLGNSQGSPFWLVINFPCQASPVQSGGRFWGSPAAPWLFQEDVPGAEGERVGAGPQRHVLLPAGLRGCGQPPLEVREWGMGPRGQALAAGAQLCLHPPGLAQLRSPLDEGASVLQQSQAHQQAQRRGSGRCAGEEPGTRRGGVEGVTLGWSPEGRCWERWRPLPSALQKPKRVLLH